MECIAPFLVKDKMTGNKVPVPCGKCPACFKKRVSHWSFRLLQEDKYSHESYFITLTYDPKHCPYSQNGYLSLQKRDVQLFFKRLRKANDGTIRYYIVGEYGGKTARPHYHALIFNVDLATLQPAWALGEIHYGFVSGASVGYTLKYMLKGRWRPYADYDDRQPQFALMSKGLGKGYLTDKMIAWHLADPLERMCCKLKDGKVISMPRYYKERIFTKPLQKAIGIVQRARMIEERDKAILSGGKLYFNEQAMAHIAAFKRNAHDVRQNEFF